jgi:DNA-binding beta-propeller fold protein YncE
MGSGMKAIVGTTAVLLVVLVVAPRWTRADAPAIPQPERIAIPDGDIGVGYDDLQYAPSLKRILVPAGRTGRLLLLDPATKALTPIDGFSSTRSFRGGHGDGTTSAIEIEARPGFIAATDRGSRTLKIVDAKAKRIVASVPLGGAPDYVRSVSSSKEVWVTEPAQKQIEVFHVDAGGPGGLSRVATVSVPGGPESLVADPGRGRVYTHTWKGQSYAIDIQSRRIVATWINGCQKSRGIALDQKRGFLFVGCAEGKATAVDVTTGQLRSEASTGANVDSVAYGASGGHLYVPSAGTADLSIFAVSDAGKLILLGKVRIAPDSHTAAFDPGSNTVFVGTPEHGEVLSIHDPFASSLSPR